MNRSHTALFICASLAVFLILTAFSSNSPAAEGCAALISERCEKCHYKTRICDAVGKKNKWSWKRTIKNMVREGAVLNKDEQKTLLTCLNTSDKSVLDLCFP